MNKLFSMMLIAAVGFTTVRTGLLDAEDSKRVAKLSLYALGPCLIISALQVELTPERLHGYIAALVFSLLVQTGFIGLGSLLRRLGFISSPCWLTYNAINFAVGGTVCEIFSICTTIIGILRHDTKLLQKRKNAENTKK